MDTSLSLVIARIIATAAKRRASDIHLSIGNKPIVRLDDSLSELSQENIITKDFIAGLIEGMLDDFQRRVLEEKKNISFVYLFEDKIRMRINIFYQRGAPAVSMKLIPLQVPSIQDLGLSKAVLAFTDLEYGLVIISGPYGSGRTTTASAIIEEINKKRSKNIITIEKPIEYIFTNNKSNIEQREIGRDAVSFVEALKYSRQEDVDIMLIGDNDEEGIVPLILEFASSGRLVFYIMDALSSVQTIEKFLGKFGSADQARINTLFSRTLQGIYVQRLVPRVGGGKIAGEEILLANSAVQTVIASGKVQQLESIIQTSQAEGMISLDQSLARAVKNGEVSLEIAQEQAIDKQNLRTMVSG